MHGPPAISAQRPMWSCTSLPICKYRRISYWSGTSTSIQGFLCRLHRKIHTLQMSWWNSTPKRDALRFYLSKQALNHILYACHKNTRCIKHINTGLSCNLYMTNMVVSLFSRSLKKTSHKFWEIEITCIVKPFGGTGLMEKNCIVMISCAYQKTINFYTSKLLQ